MVKGVVVGGKVRVLSVALFARDAFYFFPIFFCTHMDNESQ